MQGQLTPEKHHPQEETGGMLQSIRRRCAIGHFRPYIFVWFQEGSLAYIYIYVYTHVPIVSRNVSPKAVEAFYLQGSLVQTKVIQELTPHFALFENVKSVTDRSKDENGSVQPPAIEAKSERGGRES